ncbi:carbohydrate kinase family protein [Nocardia sp. IFM 10818]
MTHTVICLGAHVFDVQVRPVDAIPEGRGAQLVDRGVGCVAVTDGAAGALVVTASETIAVPAFPVEVVDTVGCGDAFSAGFLRVIGLGRHPRAGAVLGCAAAAQVARGLGSDHGDFDLAALDEFTALSVRQ